MKFTRVDIEAMAEAQVNREQKSTTNKWALGAAVVIIIGFIMVLKVNMLVGSGVCAVGLIGFMYYNSGLNKKKANYKYQLVKEWCDENKSKEVKQ